ncbi:MAG: ATP-binding protein [Candidatus Krumholzibacteriales bacterium]
MAEQISLEFPSEYKYLNLVDVLCNGIIRDIDLDQKTATEIAVSVIEACTNALEHGNKSNPRRNVKVIFRWNSEKFVVEVCDCGEGFDYQEYMKNIPDPGNIEHIRGRGIFIMKEMMDGLSFDFTENEGMKVTLEKHISE